MLKLIDIVKEYKVDEESVLALKHVSIEFRRNEFVSILGPSGCGKTTLLNIVGGLDRYTSGDIQIEGISTTQYDDVDWDTYRNRRIGFVFQSYNLIPHMTILKNVALALTIAGVSRDERKQRALEALRKVGLESQANKKPNQLSGGQMQRVAIARALVNNPEIILADEPTGALDTESGVQVMELLKEVADDRLVIMVTHNPDLAQKYSTRIVYLRDGEIEGDTMPYDSAEEEGGAEKEASAEDVAAVEESVEAAGESGEPVLDANSEGENAPSKQSEAKPKKTSKLREKLRKIRKADKSAMKFSTAISLSWNNLISKKGRTLLTSIAGSIGIIGIILVLALSNGAGDYINSLEESALSSYPITINAQEVDMTSLMTSLRDTANGNAEAGHELDAVYESKIMYEMMNSMNKMETQENNLVKFKDYIENSTDISDYSTAISYVYNNNMNVYTTDPDGNIVKSDILELMSGIYSMMGFETSSSTLSNFMQINAWQEMLAGLDGEPVNDLMKEQYDVVSGRWPENYDEIVVVVSDRNELSDMMLYALGLKTLDQIQDAMKAAANQEQIDTSEFGSWSYDDIMNLDFRVILDCDKYQKSGDSYIDVSETETGLKYLYDSDNAIKLKVVGIIRPSANAVSSFLNAAVCYTSDLSKEIIERTNSSEIVAAQLDNPDTDVISGLKFKVEGEEPSEDEIRSSVDEWVAGLNTAQKAELYSELASIPTEEYLSTTVAQYRATMDDATVDSTLMQAFVSQTQMDEESVLQYIQNMDTATKEEYLGQVLSAMISQQYAEGIQAQLGALPVEQIAAMFDRSEITDSQYTYIFENKLPPTRSESTYEQNLRTLGQVDPDSPSAIYIYASTFENKDVIADAITAYNDAAEDEADKIVYTDYVKLLMSSVTTIISAISYVLIAFVAISLIVSSIMIGIITYISVLERTKEIGILRSVGASKKDISRVFNAETLIVGFVAGALGIGITLLLLLPINIILHSLTGIDNLSATLPIVGATALVVISMALTLIAGLIPSGIAAKKDPVVALRTE